MSSIRAVDLSSGCICEEEPSEECEMPVSKIPETGKKHSDVAWGGDEDSFIYIPPPGRGDFTLAKGSKNVNRYDFSTGEVPQKIETSEFDSVSYELLSEHSETSIHNENSCSLA